jgi:hypothetical protein
VRKILFLKKKPKEKNTNFSLNVELMSLLPSNPVLRFWTLHNRQLINSLPALARWGAVGALAGVVFLSEHAVFRSKFTPFLPSRFKDKKF